MYRNSNLYTRYFYHSFPQWIGSQDFQSEPSYDSALRVLSLMFKWGLLLTPEEIVFQGEAFKDENNAQPIRILQRRLCLTELAEDELAEHTQVFGPAALEFDQGTLRRIGGMPVVYIPQSLSTNPEHDNFALIGQTFVYRLFDTYQLLSDLADIHEFIKECPEVEVTLGHPKRDIQREYPTDLLRHFLESLTYGKQPLTQLSSALRILGCFFYPTDASLKCRLREDDGRLAYYREREWRIVSDLYFGGTPLDDELPLDAKREIAAAIAGSSSPYEDQRLNGTDFTDACKIIRTFCGESIMNSVRRIFVPKEIRSDVERLAQKYGYKGTVVDVQEPSKSHRPH
jgi:hypothetical protein